VGERRDEWGRDNPPTRLISSLSSLSAHSSLRARVIAGQVKPEMAFLNAAMVRKGGNVPGESALFFKRGALRN
jgi:hypothetical protein